MTEVALGFMAHIGWLNVAAIRVKGDEIHAVRTACLITCPPGDPTAKEPYHVAGGFDGLSRVTPPPDPTGTVTSGLQRQRKETTTNLRSLLLDLSDWQVDASWAALFTGRGRQPDTLAQTLGSHAHIHIAEGNAVREAATRACTTLGIQVARFDKRDFSTTVSTVLQCSEADALSTLKVLTPEGSGRWRKEEKLCALAAWVALRMAP